VSLSLSGRRKPGPAAGLSPAGPCPISGDSRGRVGPGGPQILHVHRPPHLNFHPRLLQAPSRRRCRERREPPGAAPTRPARPVTPAIPGAGPQFGPGLPAWGRRQVTYVPGRAARRVNAGTTPATRPPARRPHAARPPSRALVRGPRRRRGRGAAPRRQLAGGSDCRGRARTPDRPLAHDRPRRPPGPSEAGESPGRSRNPPPSRPSAWIGAPPGIWAAGAERQGAGPAPLQPGATPAARAKSARIDRQGVKVRSSSKPASRQAPQVGARSGARTARRAGIYWRVGRGSARSAGGHLGRRWTPSARQLAKDRVRGLPAAARTRTRPPAPEAWATVKPYCCSSAAKPPSGPPPITKERRSGPREPPAARRFPRRAGAGRLNSAPRPGPPSLAAGRLRPARAARPAPLTSARPQAQGRPYCGPASRSSLHETASKQRAPSSPGDCPRPLSRTADHPRGRPSGARTRKA